MFGFGKALDVLRDGDAVTRNEWRPHTPFDIVPQLFLIAKDAREHDGQRAMFAAQFVIVTGAENDDAYVRVWAPTHEDLLAEDWEHAR